MRDAHPRDRSSWTSSRRWRALAASPATLVGAFALGACASLAAQSAADPGRGGAGGSPTQGALAAVVRAAAQVEWRANPPGTARIGLLARGESAFVGMLQLEPGASVPEHRDETEEYIHVLSGGGRMWIDDIEHEVATGSTVFMPANAKVRFQNGPERTTAIQVFAGPAPAAKYEAWTLTAMPPGVRGK